MKHFTVRFQSKVNKIRHSPDAVQCSSLTLTTELCSRFYQNSTLYVNKGGYSSNCKIAPAEFLHLWAKYTLPFSRDEHGSGLDQDGSQSWPDEDWIGL